MGGCVCVWRWVGGWIVAYKVPPPGTAELDREEAAAQTEVIREVDKVLDDPENAHAPEETAGNGVLQASADKLSLPGIMRLYADKYGKLKGSDTMTLGVDALERLAKFVPFLQEFNKTVTVAEGKLSKSQVLGTEGRKLSAHHLITHELAEARGGRLASGTRISRDAVWRNYQEQVVKTISLPADGEAVGECASLFALVAPECSSLYARQCP